MPINVAERPQTPATAKSSQPVEQRRLPDPKRPPAATEYVFSDWASI